MKIFWCLLLTLSHALVIEQDVYGLEAAQSYFVNLAIGSSRNNTFRLLIDTGSSNAAVAGDCCRKFKRTFSCSASETCLPQQIESKISYGHGSIAGPLVQDTISSRTLGSHSDIYLVQINSQSSFFQHGFDGILGVAYQSLAQPAALTPPTFFDAMTSNDDLNEVFGLQLCGIRQGRLQGLRMNSLAGRWIIGGKDRVNGKKLYSGEMVYSPIIQEKWYTVAVTRLEIAGQDLGVHCRKYNEPQAIVDSGTTNLLFPPVVYRKIIQQLRRQIQRVLPHMPLKYLDASTPCCDPRLCDPTNANADVLKLPSIDISFALDDENDNEQAFIVTIPPQYYFRPVWLRESRKECRVFGIEEGSTTILGTVFMDGLYVYHDHNKQQMGLAVAKDCPNGAISQKKVTISKVKSDDWCECLSTTSRQDETTLIVGYFPGTNRCFFMFWWMYLIVLSGIVLIISVIVCCISIKRQRKAMVKTPKTRESTSSNNIVPMMGHDVHGSPFIILTSPSPLKSEVYVAGF